MIGGDDPDCPIFTDGTCISCPSDCKLRSTGLVGTPDFVCNCNCDDGSQKKCISSDAPAPVAEKNKEKLEEGQQKLEESKKKLEESKKKLEESREKLEESREKLGGAK